MPREGAASGQRSWAVWSDAAAWAGSVEARAAVRQAPDRVCQSAEVLAVRAAGLASAAAAAEAVAAVAWRRGLVDRVRRVALASGTAGATGGQVALARWACCCCCWSWMAVVGGGSCWEAVMSATSWSKPSFCCLAKALSLASLL